MNRYWSLVNNGVVYTKFNALFNFATADLDGGTTPATFGIGKYDGATWTVMAVDSANPTNIKAVNVTSTGDYQIGDICNKNTSIAYASSSYCGGSGVANVIVTGNTGGVFSAGTGLAINSSTGQVDIAMSMPGDYLASYQLAASGRLPYFCDCHSHFDHTHTQCNNSLCWFSLLFKQRDSLRYIYRYIRWRIFVNVRPLNKFSHRRSEYSCKCCRYIIQLPIQLPFRGCSIFSTTTSISIVNPGTWTGVVNNDWNNAGNWLCGQVPNASTDVTIPAGQTSYPLITTANAVHNITIQSGASVSVVSGTLQVAGAISNAGIFDVSAGTIEMNGSSLQTIPANAFTGNTIMNLIVSNDILLAGEDTLTGTLYF